MIKPPPTRDRTQASLPSLLRGARGVFGARIREALEHGGYDDIPGNGLVVIGAIARGAAPMSDVIDHLGSSKQAAGALIDTMVQRGYLDRAVDPEDRRRLMIALSQRGRAAARIIGGVVSEIEADLLRRVGLESIKATRATLMALIEGNR